jgi:coenzyme F420 biosynthesis associated uncharacterized protein
VPSGQLVDLRVARATARLVLPTTDTTPADADALRDAVRAELPEIDAAARTWTQLGKDLPPTDVRVVGRMGWVEANLTVVTGLFDQVARRVQVRPAGSAQVVGAQLGTLLGLLSTRVLGQFVLPLAGPGAGQLVVVGPNVLDLARRSPGVADDLRRTVLLHEVAHRLQFDGVPWLGEHLRSLVGRYLDDGPTDPASILRITRRLPGAVVDAVRGGGMEPIMQALLTAAQVTTLDQAQALMSLLEGHGNATMHLATAGVVQDPEGVESALQARRDDLSSKILRQVAGLERKHRQYAEGEAFVRHVVDASGVPRLNRAFADPDHLPSPEEIADPAAWLARTSA